MKKTVAIVICILLAFFLFGCSGEKFSDIVISAEDVFDAPEGEYTLRYSIPDFDKYNEKFALDLQVTAFDENNKLVPVTNNRTINVEADKIYYVTVFLSSTVGEVASVKKSFTVTAVKTPRKVVFFTGAKVHKEISTPYGGSLELNDYLPVPDTYTMTGTGVKQTIISKKWVIEIDGKQCELTADHLKNITENLTIRAKYEYKVEYQEITIDFVNGEGAGFTPPITQLCGQEIAKPSSPERAGYVFDGWYKDAEYKEIFAWKNTSSILSDITLYAKWLKYDDDGYEKYFLYESCVDDDGYDYYKVALDRNSSFPDDIVVPCGHENVPVRGFFNNPSDVFPYKTQGAFENTAIKSIVLPEGFTYGSQNAFKNCSRLTSVTFEGTNLLDVGSGAFYGCTSLSEINLPDSVTKIGDSAFYGCSSLVSVALPAALTRLSSYMFKDCVSLAEIALPDSVKEIYSSFVGCTALASVSIGKNSSLRYISNGSFDGCINLKEITLPYRFKDQSSVAEIFKGLEITIFYHERPEEE